MELAEHIRPLLAECLTSEVIKSKFMTLLNYCMKHQQKIYEDFNQCRWFVDHGIGHVRGVLMNLDRMLVDVQRRDKPFLTELELFYLLATALLHDVGMSYQGRVEDDEGKELEGMKKKLRVREMHGIYSGEMIRNLMVPIEGIGFLDFRERDIIARIAEYHQSRAPLTEEDLKRLGKSALFQSPIEEELVDREHGERIRLRLLTALLRLADACDINYDRARKDRYDAMWDANHHEILEYRNSFLRMLKPIAIDLHMLETIAIEEKIDGRLKELSEKLSEEEDPENIARLCGDILAYLKEYIKYPGVQEKYGGLLEEMEQIVAGIKILRTTREHYFKHQAIYDIYYVKDYIVLYPVREADRKWLEQALKDIKDELSIVNKVLIKYVDAPVFRDVIIYGDETWCREELKLKDDPLIRMGVEKPLPMPKEPAPPLATIRCEVMSTKNLNDVKLDEEVAVEFRIHNPGEGRCRLREIKGAVPLVFRLKMLDRYMLFGHDIILNDTIESGEHKFVRLTMERTDEGGCDWTPVLSYIDPEGKWTEVGCGTVRIPPLRPEAWPSPAQPRPGLPQALSQAPSSPTDSFELILQNIQISGRDVDIFREFLKRISGCVITRLARREDETS